MDTYEVYMGHAGIWTQVALVGSGTDNGAILKSSVDALRPSIVDASLSVISILRKFGSDAIRAAVLDAAAVSKSGGSAPVATDIIRPSVRELASIFIALTPSTDTALVRVNENTNVFKFEGIVSNGNSYGGGTYGSGLYGVGTTSTGSGEWDSLDFESTEFNTDGSTTTVEGEFISTDFTETDFTADIIQELTRVDNTNIGTANNMFEFSAGWEQNTSEHFSSLSTSTATLRFHGTSFSIYATKNTNYGYMKVTIDNNAPITVSCYSATAQTEVSVFHSGVINDGQHTVVISPTGTRQAESTGNVIAINYANIAETAPPVA